MLNRWLIKSEPFREMDKSGIEPFLGMEGGLLLEHELAFTPQEELERNWRYFISENKEQLYQTNTPENAFSKDKDKYIYCLCSVYCKKEQDVFLYATTYSPMRVWINGQLVFKSSLGYNLTREPHFTSLRLNEGINIVLVERSFLVSHIQAFNSFFVSLVPYRYVLSDESECIFFDKNLFKRMQKNFAIIPERVFNPAESDVSLIVLPRYFKGNEKEKIKLSVVDSKGEEVKTLAAYTSEPVFLGLGEDVRGMLYITAESMDNPARNAEIYVFRGDFRKDMDKLLEKAAGRQDACPCVTGAIKRLADVPDETYVYVAGSTGVMNEEVYSYLLEKLYNFESYMNTPDGPEIKDAEHVFGKSMVFFRDSEIDDGFTAYNIYLPDNYDPEKTYPLALDTHFGYGMSRYPMMIQYHIRKHYFSDVIIASTCGRGGFNKDYINEAEIFTVINDIMGRYKIDRDRIYAMCSCTGSLRALSMATRKPDLFAAVVSITATARLDLKNPEYEWLKNIDNLAVYSICNLEDHIFNGARVLNTLRYIKNVRSWSIHGFSHVEFDHLSNTALLLEEVIKERKEKYPKHLQFTTYEPIYNKSYWLKVEYIEDLSRKSVVKAGIKSSSLMEIETENVGVLGILAGLDEMGLCRDIRIRVDNQEESLCLTEYSYITVTLKEGGMLCETVSLSRGEFFKKYNSISLNEEYMGIKELYFSKCSIIRPELCKGYSKVFIKGLDFVLRNPLKERNRNYKYNLINKEEADGKALGSGNFIYAADTRSQNDFLGRMLDYTGIKADEAGITIEEAGYTGDYFALVKCKNPFNHERQALLILINNECLEKELLGFLNSFDTNSLFYSDAVVYNNGCYTSFRKYKKM